MLEIVIAGIADDPVEQRGAPTRRRRSAASASRRRKCRAARDERSVSCFGIRQDFGQCLFPAAHAGSADPSMAKSAYCSGESSRAVAALHDRDGGEPESFPGRDVGQMILCGPGALQRLEQRILVTRPKAEDSALHLQERASPAVRQWIPAVRRIARRAYARSGRCAPAVVCIAEQDGVEAHVTVPRGADTFPPSGSIGARSSPSAHAALSSASDVEMSASRARAATPTRPGRRLERRFILGEDQLAANVAVHVRVGQGDAHFGRPSTVPRGSGSSTARPSTGDQALDLHGQPGGCVRSHRRSAWSGPWCSSLCVLVCRCYDYECHVRKAGRGFLRDSGGGWRVALSAGWLLAARKRSTISATFEHGYRLANTRWRRRRYSASRSPGMASAVSAMMGVRESSGSPCTHAEPLRGHPSRASEYPSKPRWDGVGINRTPSTASATCLIAEPDATQVVDVGPYRLEIVVHQHHDAGLSNAGWNVVWCAAPRAPGRAGDEAA